jgi:hypothetical protein
MNDQKSKTILIVFCTPRAEHLRVSVKTRKGTAAGVFGGAIRSGITLPGEGLRGRHIAKKQKNRD